MSLHKRAEGAVAGMEKTYGDRRGSICGQVDVAAFEFQGGRLHRPAQRRGAWREFERKPATRVNGN